MSEMTMRERMLAVVQNHEHDRVPFVQYSGIAGVSNEEIWSVIGRENMGLLAWCGFHLFEDAGRIRRIKTCIITVLVDIENLGYEES